jgi:drug/metabolite transporter (DMT)-like permease
MRRTDGPPRNAAVLGIVLAIFGISFAGPLVKLSSAHPIAIAVWRLAASLVLIAGFLLVTGEWREWRKLTLKDFLLGVCAGVFLAVHFCTWNASVQMTTILLVTALGTLQPMVIALLSSIFLKERPTSEQFAGLAIATLGAVIISIPSFSGGFVLSGNRPLVGNVVAFIAMLAVASYMTTGRHLRGVLSVWSFAGLVYGMCFLSLLIIAFVNDVQLLPQPPREWMIFVGLAIGPMLLGHTVMNWAIRYLPAYVVSLTVLAEPIGGTLLGVLLPGVREIPSMWTFVGGAVLLLGAAVTIYKEGSRRNRSGT